MSRFLFLVLSICLYSVFSAPYTLTGELQAWSQGDLGDFGRAEAPPQDYTITTYYSSALNLFGKPTYVGGGATVTSTASFADWWGNPLSKQNTLYPYSIVMDDKGGGVFEFNRPTFNPYPNNGTTVQFFSFHVRTEITLSGSASISVQSSDDFAIYLGGSLVCSQTGYTNAVVAPKPCTLTAVASGSAVSQYVDIFYARRSASSSKTLRFQLVSSNANVACSIFSRSILTRGVYPFIFGSGTVTNVQPLNGAVIYPGASPVAQLLSAGQTSAAAQLYSTVPIRYRNGLSIFFRFNYTGGVLNNTEGFAVVLQSYQQSAAEGTGSNLGYNFPKSLAIEFDAYQSSGCDSLAAPHVDIRSSLSTVTATSACGTAQSLTTSRPNTVPNLLSGSTYEVLIEYIPPLTSTATNGTITVWIGTSIAGSNYHTSRFTAPGYVAQGQFSNSALMSMFGSGPISVGFTTAAGLTNPSTNLYVWDWKVWSVPVGAFQSSVSPATGWNTPVARNNQGSASFALALDDACGSPITFGTDIVTAQLQNPATGAAVGNTMVTDLGTGSYNIWFWHTVAANYSLFVYVYNQPSVQGTVSPYFDQPYPVTIVPDVISAPNSLYTPTTIGSTSWMAGLVVPVNVTARDQFNNSVFTPSTGFSMFFSSQPTISPYAQVGDTYLFNLSTTVAATGIKIFVRYLGTDVQLSPTQTLSVSAGFPPDAQQTAITLIGAGLQGSTAGVPQNIDFQCKDLWSNTLSNLTGISLSVTMACLPGYSDSRCSSPNVVNITKTFGPAGNSWFRVTWVTPVVGPCYSLAIDISPAVNNVTRLPGVPNVCVIPNVASGRTSIITPQSIFSAGSQGTIYIQARDAYNNSRTGPNASPFQVQVGSVSVTCGGSGASGTGVNGLLCVYNQGGIYQVTLTPTLAGNQTVTVVNPVNEGCGTPLGYCNVSSVITVGAGPAYAPNDIIQNLANPVVAGTTSSVNLTSLDFYNNTRLFDADTKNFVITIIPQGQSTSTATIGTLTPLQDGLYTFSWGCTLAATYDVSVKLLGQSVSNSPLSTLCKPALTNLSQCTVSGPGTAGGQESTQTYFDVKSIDTYGNPTNGIWPDAFTCDICFQTNCPNTTFSCVVSSTSTPGTWRVNYTVPPYVAGDASFTLRLHLTPNVTGTPQNRIFTLYSSNSGAYLFGVVFPSAAALTARTGCSASNYPSLSTNYVAGSLSYLYLGNFDASGCTAPINKLTNEPTWSLEFNGPVKFSGSVSQDPATTPAQAIYNISFVPTRVGNYTVRVLGGPVETTQSLNGLWITVSPGPLDPPSSTISSQVAPVVAGNPVTFNMTLNDEYKNRLLSATGHAFTIKVLDDRANDVTSQTTVTFDNGANIGFVTITITPTKAGVGSFLVYADDATNSLSPRLIGSRSYPLTVLAGPISQLTTCFWTAFNGTMCPSNPAPTATAGAPFTVPLYARDRYSNEINDANLTFALGLTSNTIVAVRTSAFLGSQGLYSITFQANKTVTLGTLTATASSPALQVANTTLSVQPAELSNVTSYVTGLMANYTAGDFVNWTLHARDIYDNAWFDTGAAQIDLSLSGPENAVKGTSLVGNGFIKSDFANPGALYNYAYLPRTASTNTLPTPLPYVIKFIYNGVELESLNGNAPFLVYPSAPYAPNTVIPQLVTPLIPAGQMTNITVSLQDVFGNSIRQGGTPVNINFYQGQGTSCLANGSLDSSHLVSNFTNRRGYIQLDPSNYVTDNGNGDYTVTIWSVVADYYYASLWVGGNQTVPCRSIQTIFQIVPLAINGTNSLITLPVDAVADGKTQSVLVTLRDKYDNLIRTGGASIGIGLTPADNPTICPSNSTLLQNITNQANITHINDNNDGSYVIEFTVYKAQTYALVVTVNNNATYNGSAIGQSCLYLTISPWYVYTWTYTLSSSIFEALPNVLVVNPKDYYGNDVLTGAHFWRLIVNRETLDVLAPYRFAFPTPRQYPYNAVYNAEHFGNFTATLRLVQDPKYADPALYPVASVASVVDLTVTAATCNRETSGVSNYRCPDYSGSTLGGCVRDRKSVV